MEARVRFYGNYRRLVQAPEVSLEIADEATPLDLVRCLAARCGDQLRAVLLVEKDGSTRLQAGVRIAVGAEVIDFSSDLHQPLARGAGRPIEVFIFPPLMGGR
jgi:molybdopterin converting factor small subunit